jgi:hypothetical protein
MAGIAITTTPSSLSELAQFIGNEARWMVGKEMPVQEVQRAGLSFPFILTDIAEPGILLLFYLVRLVDV